MKVLAWFVAFGIMVIGVALCVVTPERVVAAAPHVLTLGFLYAAAALRVGMGLVLVLIAPRSRAPRALRALGIFVFVAGIATPFFGVERSRAVADWAATQGTLVSRSVGVLMLALGGFIAFAVSARRPSSGERT